MVLEKNLLEDILHSETIQYTMVNARLFDAWTLDEVGGRAQKRQRWWFQDQ